MPHQIFSKYKLKFLDDPQEIFESDEAFYNIVRTSFEKKNPILYKLISEFRIDVQDMNKALLWIEEGVDVKDAALRFVEEGKIR